MPWKYMQYQNGKMRTTSDSGGSSTLSGLTDTNISNPSNNQILTYNSSSSKWVNATAPATGVTDVEYDEESVVDANGVAHLYSPYLEDIADVNAESPSDGDVLTYDSDSNEWMSKAPTSGSIENLTDVNISSLSNNQILKYDSSSSKWVNSNESGGASNLTDLGDTSISTPSNGQVLKYNSSSSKWVNSNESSGSSTLAGLTDVDTTGVADTNVLAYDSSSSKWVPASAGSGGSSTLAGLTDVDTTGATNGQVLKFDTYSNKWVNGNESTGVTTLAGLTDVDTTGVSDGNALIYDNTTSKWIPGDNNNVDDVKVNGTTVVDENKVAQIKSYKELTQAQYDALPSSKLTDGILYCITDDGMNDGNKFAPVIYSTEEREIGTYLDGKPVYAKTFVTNCDSGDISNTLLSNLSIEVVIDLYLMQWAGNEYKKYNIGYNSSSKLLTSYPSISLWTKFLQVIYTKSTDTPGSGKWTSDGVPAVHYSTDEKIIGTWIDGKPLYQKTLTCIATQQLSNSAWTQIQWDSEPTNIYQLINAELNAVDGVPNTVANIRFFYDNNHICGASNVTAGNSIYSGQIVTFRYTKTTD